MKLFDQLPIKPSMDGDEVLLPEYTKMLKAVNSKEELLAFTTEWAALFKTGDPLELVIADGTYDIDKAFECHLKLKSSSECLCAGLCIARFIWIPRLLAYCVLVAEKHDVPADIVFWQLSQKYEKDKNANK